MALPTLITPGAVYLGAWRSQDALVDGTLRVTALPGVVGPTLEPRYLEGGVLYDGVSDAIFRKNDDPGGLGDGILQINGNASLWTPDATLLAGCEGTTRFQHLTRGRWEVGQSYSAVCGWEAWVANQVCYLECAADSGLLIQLDRGSGRRGFGTAAWNTNPWNVMLVGETAANVNAYINGSGSIDTTISFDGEMSTGGWDAYILGPFQRTAGGDYPPGYWEYTNSLLWSRHVVVSTPVTSLDPTDVTNLYAWLDGTEFGETRYTGMFAMCP